MDPSFDMWLAHSNVYMQPQQNVVYNPMDIPPGASKVPSLTASPVSNWVWQPVIAMATDEEEASCTYDQFPAQVHREYYPQIADEPVQYNKYQMPMTPSEFGSDHDTPYCSPPSLSQHIDPIYTPVSAPGAAAERHHSTSGVCVFSTETPISNSNVDVEEESTKPSSPTSLP